MSLLIAGELNWKCPFHFVRILGLHGVFAGAPQFACGFVFGGPSRDRAVLRARSVSSRHCWPLPGVGRDCCHGGALLFLSSARTLVGCAERCCVPLLGREHRYGWRKKKQETETLPAEKNEPGSSSGFHLACLRICRLLLLSACCKPAWTGAQFVLFQPRDSSIF